MASFTFLHTSLHLIKRKLSNVNKGNTKLSVSTNLKFTEWTGIASTQWEDASNWTDGLPFRHLPAFIPAIPVGNHFPVISDPCVLDFTLKNEGLLEIDVNIILSENGFFQNYGLLKIKPTCVLTNEGKLINQGTISNEGTINQNHIFFNAHLFNNRGTFTEGLSENLEEKAKKDHSVFNILKELRLKTD